MVVVNHEGPVFELLEDIGPDWSPYIKQFVVVSVVAITRKNQISHRPHVMIHDGVESPEMDLSSFEFLGSIVCGKVATVEVGRCDIWPRATVLRNSSVELSDVPRVFNIECRISIHEDLRSIS